MVSPPDVRDRQQPRGGATMTTDARFSALEAEVQTLRSDVKMLTSDVARLLHRNELLEAQVVGVEILTTRHVDKHIAAEVGTPG